MSDKISTEKQKLIRFHVDLVLLRDISEVQQQIWSKSTKINSCKTFIQQNNLL